MKPGEHKTVQARILDHAEAEGALLGQFRHLHTDIDGNREFVEHLRNRGKFFDHEEKRERDLILIDYDDPERPPPPADLGRAWEVLAPPS
jgi:hypothetical protein